MSAAFLGSRRFWIAFVVTFVVTLCVSAWETGLLAQWIPTPLRPPPDTGEWTFAGVIIVLMSLNVGLYAYRRAADSCPVGTKRATGLAGMLGAATLLCPACTVLPLTILGTTATLGILSPFLPLLRIVSLVLLAGSLWLLWPKKN
jgi:hypothetical protein